MNTAQIKLVMWGAVAVLATGTLGYLALSLSQSDGQAPPSRDHMARVLGTVPAIDKIEDHAISGKLVDRGLKLMDWTGQPPPPPPLIPNGKEDLAPPPRETVASLLKIRGIRYHGDAPANSEVVFKYLSAAQVTVPGNADGTFLKRAGDKLDGRLNQIRIAMIYPNGVEFAFENEPKREHEFVEKEPFDLGADNFAVVGDGMSPIVRDRGQKLIARGPEPPPPGQTQRITPTKFRIGTDDALELNERYPEILTNEITVERHRDPRTKQFDGVIVKGVKPDSIAARHGVQEGDVIKSVNGHPVTSKEDAIVFVKNNKDKYTEWVVEIWNKGQTRTVTYYPPKK